MSVNGTLVVVRYTDGRMIKGTTQDFAPAKTEFHVFPRNGEASRAQKIEIENLKAVFFVKTYDGDPEHSADYNFAKVKGHGRKAIVTFNDGETIVGFTMGYHPEKAGFFLVPAEEDGNNERVFILNAAVKDVNQV